MSFPSSIACLAASWLCVVTSVGVAAVEVAPRATFDFVTKGGIRYPGVRFKRSATVAGSNYELLAASTPSGPWSTCFSVLEPVAGSSDEVVLRQAAVTSGAYGFLRLKVSSATAPAPAEYTIQGPVTMGEMVTVGRASWQSDSSPAIRYQWLLNGVAIPGETRSWLVVPAADGVLSCEITISDGGQGSVIRTVGTPIPQAPFSFRWRLDGARDFPSVGEGAVVPQWTGTGISSAVQDLATARPVYRNHAVTFDGNDHLSFPMWEGGIGGSWTIAALAKFDNPSIPDYGTLWGATSNRALETFHFKNGLGLITGTEKEAFVASPGFGLLLPNDNWRKVVMTSEGGTIRCWIDGVGQSTAATTGVAASLSGAFRVGKGRDGSANAPFSLRWLAFYPSSLNAAQLGALSTYLEGLKEGQSPPTTLFIEGGQSNHQVSHATTSGMRAAAFPNPSFAVDAGTGGTPLYYWWSFVHNDPRQGMGVCPEIDVSAAPVNSVARQAAGKFRGQATLDSWKTALEGIAANPRRQVFVHWSEGETATGDSRYTWLPNTDGDWSLVMKDAYQNADDYPTLAAGWNAHIRTTYACPDAFFIYHFVAFPDALQPGMVQEEGIVRRNWNLRQAMRNDPRWLANDITGMEREPDNIHLTSPATKAVSSPDTGSECFGRAQVRLDRAAAHLATLSYDARMLAMRAIDMGQELTDAQMDACEAFVASPAFGHLHSLVVPVLVASNKTFDQPRARRSNLLVHLWDRYNTKFEAVQPPRTLVHSEPGADPAAIRSAVGALLTAWGLQDQIDVVEDLPDLK
ncbi:LamG-like jellyroll fold domain-containing protein [Luteolibacter sp. LG18]|uniref:LamG-like jellyroll fold domain-containing protein n=1 Tax=Luteolibacter sp. LG18 TaxID=2819286 RepID=UPI002B2C5C3A|nr:hypothetical protein llg_11600 [Luteolibacter sp. LG18]